MKRKIAILGLAVLLVLLGFGLLVFKLRYGGPTVRFPDRTTEPLLPVSAVEVVAQLDEAPGNLAVAPDGRVFFTFHPEGRPRIKVAELVDGRPVPWPDASWQTDPGDGSPWLDTVFSVRIDRQGRLWTLDPGFHGLRQPRLLAFDLESRALVHRWDLPSEIAGLGSYVQDFQVDPSGETVYLADLGVMARKPALIVYDVASGRGRRVLERHASVTDKPYLIDAQGREMILLGGLFAMHPALDSIALDRRGEWLFYGPMSHEDLFRVRTADLKDDSLGPGELASRVERYGPKVQSDGLSTDLDGNLYITDVEHGALAVLTPERRLATLVRDPRWRWPDGLSFGPGGWLYVTDSALPDIMMRTRGHIRASAPFFLFRVRTGREGIPGH